DPNGAAREQRLEPIARAEPLQRLVERDRRGAREGRELGGIADGLLDVLDAKLRGPLDEPAGARQGQAAVGVEPHPELRERLPKPGDALELRLERLRRELELDRAAPGAPRRLAGRDDTASVPRIDEAR